MADETTTDSTAQNTSDATAQNTDVQDTGAGTDTAQQTQAQEPEKKFTQADLDRHLQTRLKSAVKAELKKMADGDEGKASVEDLQRQLSEKDTRIRNFEAREAVESFLNDGRNKLNIKSENVRGIQELVIPRLEYDDDGRPINIKEAIESAKIIAPALFVSGTSNINAFSGNGQKVTNGNMNDFIRQAAGHGS